MTTTEIGRLGEELAVKFLKKNKYKIIERNKHCSHNEIDIIAKNKEYIVFVEVKTRSTENDLYSYFGTPAQAVTYSKKKRVLDAARSYLRTEGAKGRQPRIDVIEVYLEKDTHALLKINHIENAFGA